MIIEQLHTLRIFISYKRVDKERVFAIKDSIEQSTGEKCWIDLDGIESDAQFADVIIKAINQCEVFIFMYSKEHTNIVDYDADWTIREISFAQKKRKRIVFVNIDNTPLTDWFEMVFGTKQQVNATDLYKLERLYKDLCLWLNIDVSQIGQVQTGVALNPEEKLSQQNAQETPQYITKDKKVKAFWQHNKKIINILLLTTLLMILAVMTAIKFNPMTAEQIIQSYDSALVMLHTRYHFEVECGNLDISLLPNPNGYNSMLLSKIVVEWNDDGSAFLIPYNGENSMVMLGTGTFIGKEGNIVTNLQIARPWQTEKLNTTEGAKYIIDFLEEYYHTALTSLIEDADAQSLKDYIPELKVRGVLDGCYATLNGNYFDMGNAYACSEVMVEDEAELAIIRTKCTYVPTKYISLKKILDKKEDNNIIKNEEKIFVCGLPDPKYNGIDFPLQKCFVEGNNPVYVAREQGTLFNVTVPRIFDITTGGPVLDSHGQLIGIVCEILSQDESSIFYMTPSHDISNLIYKANILR